MLDNDIVNRLDKVLVPHAAFKTDRALRVVFTDGRIAAWLYSVPETFAVADRVSQTVAYLVRQWANTGENALYLFVRVLADGANPATWEQDELHKLADELAHLRRDGVEGRRGLLAPPAPPSPFVGRAGLRERVGQALRQGRVQRLVGMGGIGKTDLAKIVAQDVAGDFDRVLWVRLERAPTSEMVFVDICRALGETPGSRPAEVARHALAQGRVLLVLDNGETAPETVEDVLAEPGRGTILLTSRNRMIGSLAGGLQEVKPLERAESLALWEELVDGQRGSNALKGGTSRYDEDLNRLCDLVGDLPQALRLVEGYVTGNKVTLAEYVALLAETELAETLHLGRRRTQSVPVALGLTLGRLDEPAKDVLAVLAVDGGETVGEAAVAAGLGWAEGDRRLRGGVNGLVQRSLVERVAGRCSLHPLVRRYAQEQLPLAQDPATLARLGEYYLTYAEAHDQPQRSHYDALEAERTNLLAAMTVAYEGAQWDKVSRFAWALTIDGVQGFLPVRGYWAELKRWLGQGLEAAGQMGNTNDIAAFTHNLAIVAQRQGEYGEARGLYERSLQIKEEVGNRHGVAQTYGALAIVEENVEKFEEAERLYKLAKDTMMEIGDVVNASIHMFNLALLYEGQGRLAEAVPLLEEAVAIAERVGLPDVESDRKVLERVRGKIEL